MFFTSAQIIDLLLQYKYFILFPITVLEGPVVTMISGMLSSPAFGYLSVFWVFPIVVIGDLVGDIAMYAMGRYGRHSFIHKWGKYLGLNDERVQAMEDHFERHPGKTLLFGKLTHAVGSVVLFAAGMGNVPFWKFLWYNFIGTLPKSLVLMLSGYFFGHAFEQINNGLNYVSGVAIILIAPGIILYLYRRNNKEV